MNEGMKEKLVIPKLVASRVKDQLYGLIKDLESIFISGMPTWFHPDIQVIPKSSNIDTKTLGEIKAEVTTNMKAAWQKLLDFVEKEVCYVCSSHLTFC